MKESDVNKNEREKSFCVLKIKTGGTERQETEKTIHKEDVGQKKKKEKRERTIRSQIKSMLICEGDKRPHCYSSTQG